MLRARSTHDQHHRCHHRVAPSRFPPDEGDHHFFLNHLATVKVGAGGSDSGLTLVEFVAPRGFGPPLHVHTEEDELMYVLEGEIRIDLGGGDSTVVVGRRGCHAAARHPAHVAGA